MSSPPQTVLQAAAAAAVEGDIEQTFTLFNTLPTELRLKIWEAAKAAPQIIYITEHNIVWDATGELLEQCDITSSNGASSLLFTNRESRYIALKDYKVMQQGGYKAYADISSDMIYFSCWTIFQDYVDTLKQLSSSPEELADHGNMLSYTEWSSNLRHIVISDTYRDIIEPSLTFYMGLKRLESITLHADMLYGNEDWEEEDYRNDWNDFWLGKKAPKLLFIPSEEMKKLMKGDLTWWQAEMENTMNEDVVEQEE